MDEKRSNNTVLLRGSPAGEPGFSHQSRGERFYSLPLEVTRLSGTADRINLILRREQLSQLRPSRAGLIEVRGELRSFNNRSGEGSRLVITVLAREIVTPGENIWENRVELTGTLCKSPNYRTTPLGREICDLMLAVNRPYGRSDYLPCIAWGQNARRAAEWRVGDRVWLLGRLQSREYIKNLDGEAVRRTAFEVSITEIEPEEER